MVPAVDSYLQSLDTLLDNRELRDVPRSILLLHLCKTAMVFAPDKVGDYWNQLAPLRGKVPADLQSDLSAVQEALEGKGEMTGFAGEIAAEVDRAKQYLPDDPAGAESVLRGCEARIEKRRWPAGKRHAWTSLAEAWATVDRGRALALSGHLSGAARESLLKRMNTAEPLSREEWAAFVEAVGGGKATSVAWAVLKSDPPSLALPGELALKVGERIRSKMDVIVQGGLKEDLGVPIANHLKLVILSAKSGDTATARAQLAELWTLLTRRATLGPWVTRFNLLEAVIGVCATNDAIDHQWMPPLFEETPAYLRPFVKAEYAAARTPADCLQEEHRKLMADPDCGTTAQAWFLVRSVARGHGDVAFSIARGSPNEKELMPRLRRAWLVTHPDTAASAITAADMAGDPIGEFLALGSVAKQVQYLKEVTNNGRRAVPGAMWVQEIEDDSDQEKGFWGRLTAGGKTLEEVVQTYVAQNPLYSTYRTIVLEDEQFSEYLRFHGFGEYAHADLDRAMARAFSAWDDEDPERAGATLERMWRAIKPDENLLQVDFLRNAILERSRRVTAAHPDTLLRNHLNWVNQELVMKGRSWQSGRTTLTLRFAPQMPVAMAVSAAAEMGEASPERRDQIVVKALSLYVADPGTVENAAMVYNSDREDVELDPPVELSGAHVDGWQAGAVKTAVNRAAARLRTALVEDAVRQMQAPQEGFEPYLGTGICDVCNGDLTPGQAFLVPTKVFWDSPKYHEYLRTNPVTRGMLAMWGITVEEHVARQTRMDQTEYSAVCAGCIHLFT